MTDQEIARLRRAVALAIYGCLLSVAAALAIGIGNVAYSNHLDGRQRAEARQQEQTRTAVAEQTRRLVCGLATAQADALADATSEPGKRSLQAWRALSVRFNCT